jgi:hypothetical protein
VCRGCLTYSAEFILRLQQRTHGFLVRPFLIEAEVESKIVTFAYFRSSLTLYGIFELAACKLHECRYPS